MARKRRQIERVAFTVDDLAPILTQMERLAAARDGWMNLVPRLGDEDERPTSLGFFALFGGGGSGATMCTWIPGGLEHHGDEHPSLGITHRTGRRVFAELQSLAVPIPDAWRVEQDHPRRGLILRIPSGEANEDVLAWGLRAVAALSSSRADRRWHADVYIPAN